LSRLGKFEAAPRKTRLSGFFFYIIEEKEEEEEEEERIPRGGGI